MCEKSGGACLVNKVCEKIDERKEKLSRFFPIKLNGEECEWCKM